VKRLIVLIFAAAVAMLGVTAAHAAPAAPARAPSCSQSIVDPSHTPDFITGNYNIVVRTDTPCGSYTHGRWMRARMYCKGLGHWDNGNSVRSVGARSITGSQACNPSRWGFAYYKGQDIWVWKQEGQRTTAARATLTGFAIARNKSDASTEKNGCHYGAHLNPLSHRSATIEVTWDSCHRDIWAYAKCFQLPPLAKFRAVGPYRQHYGDFSTAQCGGSSFAVAEAGFRYHYKKCVPNGVGTCTVITVTGQYTMYN
jgi:hypothetical protein